MTIYVKDAVLEAARTLGLVEDVENHLNGGTSAVGERDCNVLLAAFNRVERELATDYLPILAEETVVASNGEIPYEILDGKIVRVICVEDEWGNSLKYKLFPDRVTTKAGKVKLTYALLPTEKGIDDCSDYQLNATRSLFAYGMAAEYALAVGELERASVLDKKYKDAVQAAYRTMPCKKLRSRRWA